MGVVCRLCLFLVLGLFSVAACSDSSSNAADSIPAAQLELMPEDTRAVAWVKLSSLLAGPAASEVQASLAGKGREPALNMLFSLLGQHLIGVDPARIDGVLLAQHVDANAGFVLVAGLDSEEALELSRLQPEEPYEGQPVYSHSGTGLHVVVLPGKLMLVAQPAALRAILSARMGPAKRPNTDSALLPYLSALQAKGPVRFVVGLPALYRDLQLDADDLTLRPTLAVSGALQLAEAGMSGQVAFHRPNAQAFVAAFPEGATDKLGLTLGEPLGAQLPPRALLSFADAPYSSDSGQGLVSRRTLKRLFHGMNGIDYARSVGVGGEAPWLNFGVATDPNSIFINFRFKDETARQAFEQAELPPGFELAPLSILESDEPQYFLVLNAYQSNGGLVSGARAEWSAFIRDPSDGKPRFMVVQAAAQDVSADPVNLLTAAEPVRHELNSNVIETYVGVKEGEMETAYFESEINWPPSVTDRVHTTREFVSANDYIFWGNGVADRGLYNGTVHNRNALRIPASDLVVRDNSRWSQYVETEPVHAFVYTARLEIVVSPWWNLDAPYLDVTDEHLGKLRDFKAGFYPGAMKTAAERAFEGEPALTTFEISNETPSVYYQFLVEEPERLEKALSLPAGFKLAPIRIFDSDTEPRHYLTLGVYEVKGSAEGVRAEWYAYARDSVASLPHRFVLDTASADVRVDPVTVLGLASAVSHIATQTTLSTKVASLGSRASLVLDLAQSAAGLPSHDLVEALGRTCFLNGVCDRAFYDGATLTDAIRRFEPASVTMGELKTPWDDLIADMPTSAFVREGTQRFAANPWNNVP